MLAVVLGLSAAGFSPSLQPPAVLQSHSAHRAPAVAAVRMYAGMARPVSEAEKDSFVQTEMRGAAMRLHTKDQAKEGQQPAQKPVSDWQPGRAEYLQFLVDSRHVYATLEDLVESTPQFAPFRSSGLERSEPLDRDIAWFEEQGLAVPAVGEQGTTYAAMLRSMVEAGRTEAFVCHFYNTYFAHTAGGRMIGKKMSDMLLDGKKLEFYTWAAGNVDKELLPKLRAAIDAMVATWDREQKDLCLAETADSFRYGGALLQHISRPAPAKAA